MRANILIGLFITILFTQTGHSQEYFTAPKHKICIDTGFKEVLVKAFSRDLDTIRYFDTGTISSVSLETDCEDLKYKNEITGSPNFPLGKLKIYYKTKEGAQKTYKSIIRHTKLVAYSHFYGFAKSGPTFICLKNNQIEIYKTNSFDFSFIDYRKLKKYLLNNIKGYDQIVQLNANQVLIK